MTTLKYNSDRTTRNHAPALAAGLLRGLARYLLVFGLFAGEALTPASPIYSRPMIQAHQEFVLKFSYWTWLLMEGERKQVVDMRERKQWEEVRKAWNRLDRLNENAIQ
jgi:hypothetical protein